MISPVKKNKEGNYFVSMEFHLAELQKYEEEVKGYKKLIKYLKEENKELEEKRKIAYNNLERILKLWQGNGSE